MESTKGRRVFCFLAQMTEKLPKGSAHDANGELWETYSTRDVDATLSGELRWYR